VFFGRGGGIWDNNALGEGEEVIEIDDDLELQEGEAEEGEEFWEVRGGGERVRTRGRGGPAEAAVCVC
jgi:hypothetical protein